MALIESAHDNRRSPLDVVEHMAAGNNWPFERAGEDEIGLVVTGRWTNYQVSFTWMNEIETLHLACAFDMKVPEPLLPSEVEISAASRRRGPSRGKTPALSCATSENAA